MARFTMSCLICGPGIKTRNGISFHKFPDYRTSADAWVCEKWKRYIEMYGISTNKIKKQSKLCSRHFTPDDYLATENSKCMTSVYVPSKFFLKNKAYPTVMVDIVEVVLPYNIEDYQDNAYLEEDITNLKTIEGNDVLLKAKPMQEDNVLIKEEDVMEVQIKEEPKEYDNIILKEGELIFAQVKEELVEENSAFIKEEDVMEVQIKEEPEDDDNVIIKGGEEIVAQIKEENNAFIKMEDVMEVQIKEENSALIKEVKENIYWIKEEDNTVLEEDNFAKKKLKNVGDAFIKEEEDIFVQIKEEVDFKDTIDIDEE